MDRDGHILTHSDSTLAILREIGHSSLLIRIAALVPKSARDILYSLIARSRYRLFGRHTTCQLIARGPTVCPNLYLRAFGTEFDKVPAAVRDLHEAAVAVGEADVVHGYGLLPRVFRALLRLPPPGIAIPLTVEFERSKTEERWTRSFGDHLMRSRQRLSDRLGHLFECFGPVRVETDVRIDNDGIVLRPVRAWIFGVPLPKGLVPRGHGRESAPAGRFEFDVEIELLGRRIVKYSGWLTVRSAETLSPTTDLRPAR